MDFQNKKTYLMGILNVTPDSFYEKSRCKTLEKALSRAKKIIEEGADIIDIGGESARPGAVEISEEEEINRIIPVIKEIRKINSDISISVDTQKPHVAKLALENGSNFINDISGFRNKKMIEIANQTKCYLCLMHMQNTPQTMQINPSYKKGVVYELLTWFDKQIKLLKDRGIEKEKIIIDPGIGFGKSVNDNIEILKNIKIFKELGFPLLVGISRKSFMGKILNKKTNDLLSSTLAINTRLIMEKVDILRVHDIAEHRDIIETSNVFY